MGGHLGGSFLIIWEVLNLKFVAPWTATPRSVMLTWAYSCTTPGNLEGNPFKRKNRAFAGLTLGPWTLERIWMSGRESVIHAVTIGDRLRGHMRFPRHLYS